MRALPPVRFLAAACALIVALLAPIAGPARADTQDIAAVSRSVVRVALVATDGKNAYFVGHGSGVVIAPGRVLTNAHVVELTRDEPNIVIGIIPSQGSKSFGGKVIAYSPGNDLALISFEGTGLPVATFFSGQPEDGQDVTAIGYPGAVDQAQGMGIDDIIHPMSPVRTTGTVSGGRASKRFDTVLHTAPLASGNSGGPLVDACGRVLGLNSFGSVSDGSDAEYGFAVSGREIASFLRQAEVQFRRTVEPCRSLADSQAAQRAADEAERSKAANRASEAQLAAREKAMDARARAQLDVIARRENIMALATLFLAVAAGMGAVAVVRGSEGGIRQLRWLGGGAALLLLLAVIAFLLRPGFDGIDMGQSSADFSLPAAQASAEGTPGARICRLDRDLSRITVSETGDRALNWGAQGCADGDTQMEQSGKGWQTIAIADEEAMATIRRFEPESGAYSEERFLLEPANVEKAAALRQQLGWKGCTADSKRLDALADMQRGLTALLPQQPLERLVYHCVPGTPPKPR